MSDARIGIFDSGIGGLTVVRELQARLKGRVPLIYLGDTARLPYGTKSESTIREYFEQNVRFLKSKGATHIVVACNSASTVISKVKTDIPTWGVIEAGAREAVEKTLGDQIAVIGTRATITSRAYDQAILRCHPGVKVYSSPAPLLVPLAEEGRDSDPITEALLREVIQPLVDQRIDTLVLGCTHYPVFQKTIAKLWPQLIIVDPAIRLAQEVAEDMKAQKADNASLEIFLTDHSEHFEAVAARLLKSPSAPYQQVETQIL